MEWLFWVVLLVVVPGTLVAWSYNRFVTQVAAIDASWANIDTQLQRRHDLVPNLVATVAGYARHERRVLDEVTRARSEAVAAVPADVPVERQARAEDGLTQGLTSLLAVSERYPQLKADTLFRDLQRQLVETEDGIAAARRLFNLEVAAYERRRLSVPSNVIASAFGFEVRRPFEIRDPSAEHVAHVSF